MSDRTQLISNPFRSRTKARAEERVLQAFIDGLVLAGGPFEGAETFTYEGYVMPAWTRGVRVESTANGKQHVLMATEHRGH